ncbi:hypothetical protein UNH65_13955 [Chitinophaga sp. 180180018-2]|nr:hypothetical protein [Chitinophaga sp. 212800010-3]
MCKLTDFIIGQINYAFIVNIYVLRFLFLGSGLLVAAIFMQQI